MEYIHIQGKSHALYLPSLTILHVERPSIPLERRMNIALKMERILLSPSPFFFTKSRIADENFREGEGGGKNFRLLGKQLKSRGKDRSERKGKRKELKIEGEVRLTIFEGGEGEISGVCPV